MLNTGISFNLRTAAAPLWRTLAMTVAVLCNGCTQEAEQKGDSLGQAREALFQSGTAWPSGNIFVCFDPTDGNNPTLLAEAQRVVASSWGRAANLSFPAVVNGFIQPLPWRPCQDFFQPQIGNYSAIAIHFCGGNSSSVNCPASAYSNNVVASNAFLGSTPVKGVVPPSMFLAQVGSAILPFFKPGFTHVSLIADDSDPFLTKFRHQVVHEFGHALAYDDEAFDLTSIMGHFAHDPLTGGPATFLDGSDIVSARTTYGRLASSHGFMIFSDNGTFLPIKPASGVNGPGPLALGSCSANDPECTWSYQLGMLVNDANPLLAIKALGGAGFPLTLSLEFGCSRNDPRCTWTYTRGRFLSDQAPGFAIKATSGLLTLANNCAGNPDCGWTLPNVMLSSYRNSTLAVNAFNGAVNGRDLKLHNACDPTNPDCTWTFTKGLILSDTNLTLKINAFGGANQLGPVRLVNNCTQSNPDCTWTWSHGQLISDNQAFGVFPINALGGAFHAADLKLNSACTASNPDCVFSGLVSRP